MKSGLKGPVPWDIAVFLIVTVVGFGYTVQDFSRKFLKGGSRLAHAGTAAEGMLDLGCLENNESPTGKLLTEGGPIRLRGKLCQLGRNAAREVVGMEIRNVATGDRATVYFHGNETSFVTDYLTMRSGRNPIEVVWSTVGSPQRRVFRTEVFER